MCFDWLVLFGIVPRLCACDSENTGKVDPFGFLFSIHITFVAEKQIS